MLDAYSATTSLMLSYQLTLRSRAIRSYYVLRRDQSLRSMALRAGCPCGT